MMHKYSDFSAIGKGSAADFAEVGRPAISCEGMQESMRLVKKIFVLHADLKKYLSLFTFQLLPYLFVSLPNRIPLGTIRANMAIFDIFKKKSGDAVGPDEGGRDGRETSAAGQKELDAGLEKTKAGLFSKLTRAVAGRSTIDAEVLDDLEEVLVTSDVGVETTVKIIRRIEERAARDKYMNASELQNILREEITALLEQAHGTTDNFGLDARPGEPYVVMVVPAG